MNYRKSKPILNPSNPIVGPYELVSDHIFKVLLINLCHEDQKNNSIDCVLDGGPHHSGDDIAQLGLQLYRGIVYVISFFARCSSR